MSGKLYFRKVILLKPDTLVSTSKLENSNVYITKTHSMTLGTSQIISHCILTTTFLIYVYDLTANKSSLTTQ